MRVFLLIMLLASLPVVFGATIHGSVYDFGLNSVKSAIVEINSSPQQKMVSKNGTYSFGVPPGSYELFARYSKDDSEVREEIVVKQDGTYVLDLILIPSLDSDAELLEDAPDVPDVEEIVQDRPITPWLAWIAVFSILGYIVYRVSRKPEMIVKKEVVRERVVEKIALTDDLQMVLDGLDHYGGSAHQKDLRNMVPFSEAKVSLLIDALEKKGLIERIKKGRGNIIVRK